jgi:fibronectin-binding autotransporter adhesin
MHSGIRPRSGRVGQSNSKLNAGRGRRAALAALVAASAGIAMLSPGGLVYADTYTFTTAGGDWLTPTNWTPNGIPGAADLAKIRTNTASLLTLNGAAMTVGGVLNDTSNIINLSNADPGANNSTLTIAGLTGQPLIAMDRAVGTTVFTIQGANSGGGTGTLGMVLGASGDILVDTNTGAGPMLNISANIGETGGSQSIRKIGPGTLNFAGVNSYTGSTEVHMGRLQLDFASNAGNKLSSTGSLIFSGGTLFMNGNASQNVSQTVGDTYVVAGQNSIVIDVSGAGQLNSTLNAGAFHRSPGAYINLNASPNSTSGGVPAMTTTSANNAYGILGGWITIGNNDWASVAAGQLTIPTYATKNDVTTWSAGDNVTNSAAFTGTVAAPITIGSLRFNSSTASTVTIAGGSTLTIGSGGILVTGAASATSTITGGNLTSGVGEMILTVGGSKTLSIPSIITDNGATPVGVTKSGSGSLILNGAHTYSGDVYLNTGTLFTNTIAPTGTPSGLGTSGTIYLGSVNVGRLVYTGAASTSSDRNFVFGEGGATVQVATNTTTLSLSGSMSGPGGLTKGGGANSGAGTSALVITGAKTYGGAVTVNPGLLSVDVLAPIGQPSGLGTGTLDPTVTLGNGTAGTLEYRGGTSATADRTLQLGLPGGSNGGSINLVATQANTLTWNGDVLWNSGVPTFTTDATNGIATANFATGPTNVRPLRVDTPGTIVFNGNVGTSTAIFGQLQKFGSGTLILNGDNHYAFGTVVSVGTLIASKNLPSNGTIQAVGTNLISGLRIDAGAAVRVAEKPTAADPTGTSVLPSMFISSTGMLDLTNNALVLDYPENQSSPAATERALLIAGGGTGAWNTGVGLTSSTAAAQASSSHRTALGYAEATSVLSYSNGTASFAGATLAEGNKALLVRYTYAGDSNLDGKVDLTDFTFLAANFNTIGTANWLQGDYNYDGNVDLTDFTYLASNFNQSLAAGSGSPGSVGTLVPEPTSALMLFIGSAPFIRRRRR